MQYKVLFVDDEANIRVTLPKILNMKGYQVTAAGSVTEALATMQRERFDVLIADLNIGQPGDGFTVVSAMRRIQPQAVTLILTGYPAFESALEAIRRQVDDYLVKPTDIEHLCDVIENNLERHTPSSHIEPRRLWLVLRDHKAEILERWRHDLARLKRFESDAALSDLTQHGEDVIEELADMLENHPSTLSQLGRAAAERHGHEVRKRGMTLPDCITAMRLLRRVIYRVIQENLLAVNTSYVISDMIDISGNLDEQLQVAVESYQQREART